VRTLLVLALLLAPALSGCIGQARACDAPWPLAFSAWADVGDARHLRFRSEMWNCTPGGIVVTEGVCPLKDALYPRLDVGNETFVLGLDASAIPERDVPCDLLPDARATIEPGQWGGGIESGWDGTVLRDGEPVRVPGDHALRVEAGGMVEVVRVTVPP